MYSFSTARRWRSPKISIRSVHSRRMVPTQRPAIEFVLGDCGGVVMTLMPIEVNTASKAVVNLASRSRDQEPYFLDVPAEVPEQFPACCVTHVPFGSAVPPARWTRRVACSMSNRT